MVNTKKSTNKAKATGKKDIIGINDIGIFEFIFEGLPNLDNRQPIGKIKPTDKMVMMLSLFDGTKPETSKHYERFNLYMNFQTKSGHLTDPVREATRQH